MSALRGVGMGLVVAFAATYALGQETLEADAAPTAEVASPEKDQARALFEKGIGFYRDGRFKDAIDEFLKAHRIFPNPVLSFNAALAYEKMGDSAGALRFYREYLRQSPEAKDRALVAQKIDELESALQSKGVQQVTVLSDPAGATVSVDGRPVGVTPWTGELNPGEHRLRLRLEGHAELNRVFELLPHRALDVSATLERAEPSLAIPAPPAAPAAAGSPPSPAAPVPPPRADAEPRRLRPVPWIVLGSSVAVLGTAGVFEALRRQSEDDVRQEKTQLARYEAFDQMERRQTTARVLTGVGAGLAVAGGVLLVLDLRRPSVGKSQIGCGPNGCTFRGEF